MKLEQALRILEAVVNAPAPLSVFENDALARRALAAAGLGSR